MPAGKLGRLPRDPSRPVPRFEDFLEAGGVAAPPLPVIPYTADVDYASEVTSWPMYCNGPDPENAVVCPGSPDGCGDCAWAMPAHALQSWTRYNQQTEVTITAAEVIKGYATTGYDPQTGANDNGTQILDVLNYLKATGYTDPAGKVHKLAGWALISDPHDEEVLAQALDLGGSVYCGANLQQAQMDQSNAGQPWNYVAGQGFEGGHAFCMEQRRGSGLAKLIMVSWGMVQPATASFRDNCLDEAYYVVSQDDIDANGVNRAGFKLPQLLAAMAEL